MSHVVRKEPALEQRVHAGAGAAGAAWEVLRVAAGEKAGRAALLEPSVERYEEPVQDRPVEAKGRRPQLRQPALGVRAVEAAVLLAVAVYYVAGLVGALAA
jgi:hypothetical protein